MLQPETITGLAEFKEIPANADFVYHLTLLERLSGIHQGLKPNPDRGATAEWRARETLIDEMRPEKVCLMGLSRSTAVYAHPDFAVVDGIYDQNSRSLDRDDRRLAAVEIAVDPETVLVCDAFDIGSVHTVFNDADGSWNFSKQAQEKAKNYWLDAITLRKYRELYDVTCGEDGLSCCRKNGAEGVPYTLVEPEVLVPGPVDSSYLRWVSSALHPMSRRAAWQ